jgi:hypothetical protein
MVTVVVPAAVFAVVVRLALAEMVTANVKVFCLFWLLLCHCHCVCSSG